MWESILKEVDFQKLSWETCSTEKWWCFSYEWGDQQCPGHCKTKIWKCNYFQLQPPSKFSNAARNWSNTESTTTCKLNCIFIIFLLTVSKHSYFGCSCLWETSQTRWIFNSRLVKLFEAIFIIYCQMLTCCCCRQCRYFMNWDNEYQGEGCEWRWCCYDD